MKARRKIPILNGPPSEATYFHKSASKRHIAMIADALRTFYLDGKKPPIDLYEMAKDLGGLADLQTFLVSPDAAHTTRGKLFHAYKTALANSDPTFGAYTDSINWKKTHAPEESKEFTGRILLLLCDAPTLGAIIKEHSWKPPTLAEVRAQFRWLHPNNASLWPTRTPYRDKTHRTTIRRMGLPIARDRIGRPRKK